MAIVSSWRGKALEPNRGYKAISFRSPTRATFSGRMAETVFLRRWSAAIQTMAVLVAIAIIARCEPSPNAGAASDRVLRQSSSLQVVQVVTHEALARHPGKVVRSSGPWPVAPATVRAVVQGHIREFSSGGITLASSAVVTCYDATAPPGMLLT